MMHALSYLGTEMMQLENVVDLDISGISMHSDFQSLMQVIFLS